MCESLIVFQMTESVYIISNILVKCFVILLPSYIFLVYNFLIKYSFLYRFARLLIFVRVYKVSLEVVICFTCTICASSMLIFIRTLALRSFFDQSVVIGVGGVYVVPSNKSSLITNICILNFHLEQLLVV